MLHYLPTCVQPTNPPSSRSWTQYEERSTSSPTASCLRNRSRTTQSRCSAACQGTTRQPTTLPPAKTPYLCKMMVLSGSQGQLGISSTPLFGLPTECRHFTKSPFSDRRSSTSLPILVMILIEATT